MRLFQGLILAFLLNPFILHAQSNPQTGLVFEERSGLLVVEAEHFIRQTQTQVRAWHRWDASVKDAPTPDPDSAHWLGASGQSYLEILPDTRATHDDKLVNGENFVNEPGQMAVLTYPVWINQPGRYYVWVRAFSTGTEDNGIHVGLDGTWPAHGRRMQWTAKRHWAWASKQRTAEKHTGVPMEIYLDIEAAGYHEIQFSMREDGFEFDKFILASDLAYRPEGLGPALSLKAWSGPDAYTRGENGRGEIRISGELKQWHAVTLSMDGPFAAETDIDPNPFLDYRMSVRFTHESGEPSYEVPGYFAADGQAAETLASQGNQWRAHLSPDKTGRWDYEVSFLKGGMCAVSDGEWCQSLSPFDGQKGSFEVGKSDKQGRDFRGQGRLTYVGEHFLQFAGSGDYFLKVGADAPETLLGYLDFDNTHARKAKVPLKTFASHVPDWHAGDPTWQDDRGKGLIGALNYLASQGVNAFSFLTYNAGGDGDNVWPFVSREDKYHYDCSKLDQWNVVFAHAQTLGLYLHFKTQETEIDDHRRKKTDQGVVHESLDGGELGPQRRLYYRELIARFGHHLALNWNLGEENTQTSDQQRAMAQYVRSLDPYQHHVVLHTFPNQQDKVYPNLLGDQSELTGVSLQNDWRQTFRRTLQWREASEQAGRPWVVANDEQGSAGEGVPPDPGYPDFNSDELDYDLHDIRKQTLWGNLMAGGAGVEYYFGYKLPQNDLLAEDFRSREQSWKYGRIALEFFQNNPLPFWEMENRDDLIGNPKGDSSKHCLALTGKQYLIYLAYAEAASLDLSDTEGRFEVWWYNPREGGALLQGRRKRVKGGGVVEFGKPPSDFGEDWIVWVKKE